MWENHKKLNKKVARSGELLCKTSKRKILCSSIHKDT